MPLLETHEYPSIILETAGIETPVLAIYDDEPAFNLLEFIDMGRRWQKIQVVRHDALAAWLWDMGPREDFFADQLHIPAGIVNRNRFRQIMSIDIVHTVAELRAMADKEREKPPAHTQIEPSGLWDGWQTVKEDAPGALIHRSVFGPGGERIR